MTALRQAPKRTALTETERSVGNRRAAPAGRVAGLIRPFLVAYALLAAGLAFVGSASFDPLVLSARMMLYAVVAALAAAVAWASTRTRARTLSDLIAGAAGFVAGFTVAVGLEGTPFPLGHVTGDVGFRLAAAERFTHRVLPAPCRPRLRSAGSGVEYHPAVHPDPHLRVQLLVSRLGASRR